MPDADMGAIALAPRPLDQPLIDADHIGGAPGADIDLAELAHRIAGVLVHGRVDALVDRQRPLEALLRFRDLAGAPQQEAEIVGGDTGLDGVGPVNLLAEPQGLFGEGHRLGMAAGLGHPGGGSPGLPQRLGFGARGGRRSGYAGARLLGGGRLLGEGGLRAADHCKSHESRGNGASRPQGEGQVDTPARRQEKPLHRCCPERYPRICTI